MFDKKILDEGGEDLRKYNYFDDNDVHNSIYDQKNDIYNIIKSIIDSITHPHTKKNSNSYDDDSDESDIETKADEKLTFSDFVQKAKSGELLNKKSWSNISNTFKGKDTQIRVILSVVIVLIVIISTVSLFTSINSSNHKISNFSSAAGQICTEKIVQHGMSHYEKLSEEYGNDVNKLVGVSFVRELDFNNDGKSELLISYNDGGVYFNEVYGFDKHKKFVSLYKKPACTVDDITHGDFVALYRHNNRYYIGANAELSEEEEAEQKAENANVEKIEFFTLSGNSFKKKYTFDYDYISEAFNKRGKILLEGFEKIRLSCIKYAESERRIAQTSSIIGTFDTNGAVISSSATDSDNKMNQAYFNLVKDYNAKYGSAKIVEENSNVALSGLAVVKQVDFNGDGTNELMMIYRKQVNHRSTDKKGNYVAVPKNEYFCEIFKWTGEKAVRIFRSDSISGKSVNGADSLYIIKKNGDTSNYCENIFTSAEKGKVLTSTSKIYEMAEYNFQKTFEAIKKFSWGYDSYYIDGEKVKKKEFDNKKDNVALFLTENDNYNTNEFDIGYVKRKSDNKADVESQLKSTIAEIQKLNKQYVHKS